MAVLAAASFVLASCGAGNPIAGKWIVHNTEEGESSNEFYTFMKDGTVERYYEEDKNGKKTRYVYQGNWKYEEPIVTISLGKRGKMNAADAVGEYEALDSEMVRYGVYNNKKKTMGVSKFVAEREDNNESEFIENGAWTWEVYWWRKKIDNTIRFQRWPKDANKEENKLDGQVSYTSEFWGDSTAYYGNYLIETDKTSKGSISDIAFIALSSDGDKYAFGGDLYNDKLYIREVLLKKSK